MEVIHIAGPSCIGKRTLVKQLCDSSKFGVRARFNVYGTTEIFFQDEPNDVVFNQAFDSIKWRDVSELLTVECDHKIHKWQIRSHRIIEQLLEHKVPQRVIVLCRTTEDLLHRIHEKGREQYTPDSLRLAMSSVYGHFPPLQKTGIDVEYVDASTELYDLRSEPFND